MKIAVLLLLLLITGCHVTPREDGAITPPESAAAIPFDASLWQAARETVDFLPFTISDPVTGVIETGWGAARGVEDRFRIGVELAYGNSYDSAVSVTAWRQGVADDDLAPGVPDPLAAAALQRAITRYARQLHHGEIAAK